MTRKKVKLAFISNDAARKATFKKRKKGLMKKVSELSTLCGIDACAIVYSPYETQPDIWPDQRGAQCVLSQFKRMPEMEQSKKMVNQESFIRHRMAKAAEQLKKLRKENREKEITQLMYQCLTGKGMQGLGFLELNDLGWMLEQNLKEIYKRIEGMKNAAAAVAAPAVGAKVAAPAVGAKVELEVQRPEQWFTDLGNAGENNQQMIGDVFGHGGGGDDEMMLTYNNCTNHAAMWSNVYFP